MIARPRYLRVHGRPGQRKADRRMDVTLHLGAHRTASTSFQRYMRARHDALHLQAVGFWGPLRTRRGLFEGVQEGGARAVRRAAGRIAINLAKSAETGLRHLVISDENMMGLPGRMLRDGRLYPEAGERLARYHAAFGGRITQAVLVIRAQDLFWASLAAHGARSGRTMPDPAALAQMAQDARGWTDVIRDLACALPDVALRVAVFERCADAPDRLLRDMTGLRHVPRPDSRQDRVNRSLSEAQLAALLHERGEAAMLDPAHDGRWMPFGARDRAALQERYADDLHWLAAGAEGLARILDDTGPASAATDGAFRAQDRGHDHDRRDRSQSRLA